MSHVRLITNDGPLDTAYKEVSPSGTPFPTESTWYTDSTKTVKLLRKTVTRNSSKQITQIVWEVFASDGSTIERTIIDDITYINNIFEDTRVRTIA